jgi:arylsulfatase A-like enzyme
MIRRSLQIALRLAPCGLVAASLLFALGTAALAQQTTGAPSGAPDATRTIDGRYLPNPPPQFGGEINPNAYQSKPYWPARVVPPKGAPNVLLIMTDDAGFGVSSTFGGVIPTPALDRIANLGLRYTQFHSTALCSPTRAALITGRNHHSVGFGQISEMATGYPGYDSFITASETTIGRILRDNGYATSWFGKDHNTPAFQASQAGPFDQWPIGMGFEYFYGFVGGDTSQWQPNLFRNTTAIYPYVGNPGWNLTTAMADDAITHIKMLNETAPDKPFFVYYVPGGTHAPHHPTPEWIKKISDMHLFDKGWNELRDTIFANQKRLGVIPQDAKLTPWPDDLLKKWDALTDDEKKLFIRQVDVFAAYAAYTDHEIGRVIQAVEDMGKLDNTLIIYIEGDNGNSAEGSPNGTPNEVAQFNGAEVPVADQLKDFYDVWGSDKTYNHMAVGWTWAFDTPYKWTKQVASHFGGTRQGMAIAWPGHIKDAGGIRNQFHHMIDIVPTILEATGIPAPVMVDGVGQKPIEGVSMAYTFDKANANAPTRHRVQYFEMFGNRGIYHKGWAAVTRHKTPWLLIGEKVPAFDDDVWELYDTEKDWSQANDLSKQMPEKLHELQRLWLIEATRYNVLPLDDDLAKRFNADTAGRPTLIKGKTQILFGGMGRLAENCVVNIKNKSHAVTAEIEVPKSGAEGVIIAQGANIGGWSLYAKAGRLKYCYNLGGVQHFYAESADRLPAGEHQVRMEFAYAGGGLGKGGKATLYVDGKQVGEGDIPMTLAMVFSADDGCDVGEDGGAPVSPDYGPRGNAFNGRIKGVQIAIADAAENSDHLVSPEEAVRIAMARQ